MKIWQAPEWVECPHCHMGYQCARIGVTFHEVKQYTVLCSNCKHAFNVDVAPRSFAAPDMKVTAR